MSLAQKWDDQRPSRRLALRMQQPLPTSTLIDRFFFLLATVSAVWFAVVVALQGFRSPWSLLLFIPVWAILAYLAIPRLHKMLSDMYVPDYFFGRTRTPDGLLGDPVNMAVDGDFAQMHSVMTRAGWHRAEEITARSTWLIIVSTLTGRSYPTAPVSTLMLFGRRHNVAYQQEVEGNPAQRHHVRFWHTPEGWLLPGGTQVDWLGAGTYDTAVGFSWFTLQVTHRIDENTDIERDYVVSSMIEADPAVSVENLANFTTGYHSRNGGGDRFITDGALPIVDVAATDVPEQTAPEAPPATMSSRDAYGRVPLSALVAALLTVAVSILDIIVVSISVATDAIDGVAPSDDVLVRGVIIGVFVLLLVVELFFVRAFLRRGRRSRTILMVLISLSILTVAVNYVDGIAALQLDWTLVSAGLQCIALIAFATESTARWVRDRGDDVASGASAVAD